MQIFVINLKRALDRFAKIEDQLKALGLPFTRIEAIDGKLFDVNDSCIDPYRFRLSQRRECRNGEIGCAESHRKTWKEALKSNKPYSLILEDDAVLPNNLNQVLQLIENLELDIINLTSTGSYAINHKNLASLKKQSLLKRPLFFKKKEWRKIEAGRWKVFNLFPVEALTICECSMLPPPMIAYVVTPRACQALLNATHKIDYPIDYAYRHTEGTIRQAFSYPAYITHDSSTDSLIGDRNKKIKFSYIERLLRTFLRKRPFKRKLSLLKMYGLKKIM